MKQAKTCCFIDFYSKNYYLASEDRYLNYKKKKIQLEGIINCLIKDFLVTHFISGMQRGLEQTFADLVIDLKSEFSYITLEGVIGYENEIVNWTEFQRDKFFSIMEKTDKEVLMQYHYTYDCMRKRNIYMIKKSKYVILYGDNKSSLEGIEKYVKSLGKVAITIGPESLNSFPNIKIFK